jgi:hypothetical protein
MPTPEYKPDVSGAQLLDEFEEARAQQVAAHTLDRDCADLVLSYAKSHKSARATFDLSNVREDLRLTLLDMSDLEIEALGNASRSAVRKFVEGRDHGVFGVRIYTREQSKAVAPVPKAITTAQEQMLWRVRARAQKSGLQFQLPR